MRFQMDMLSKSEFLRLYKLAESQLPGFLEALWLACSRHGELRAVETKLEAITGSSDFPMLVEYMIMNDVRDPAMLDIAKAYAEEKEFQDTIQNNLTPAEYECLRELVRSEFARRERISKKPRDN